MKKCFIAAPLAFFYLVLTMFTPQASAQSILRNAVWRRYPYIYPHKVENETHYIYVTDWGNYTFAKASPYVCLYTNRNGTIMVSFSTFWFNTSTLNFPLPLDSTVQTANSTFYKVNVTAYDKLKILSGKPIAYLIQEWNFNRMDKPKISVALTKTANYIQGGFQIYWIVAGLSYLKTNETNCVNIGIAEHKYGRKMLKQS